MRVEDLIRDAALGAFAAAVLLTAVAAPAAADPPSVPSAADEVLGAMDPAADPCVDFYRYACGGWLDATELPSDQVRWAKSFSVIAERNRRIVRGLLEAAAADVEAGRAADPDRRRIGRFYAACMDEEAIEAAGAGPLAPHLAEVDAAEGAAALMRLTGRLHRDEIDAFFSAAVSPDYKDPGRNLFEVSQGGLGLPDRDYYLSDDPKQREIRAAYEKHVARMLGLLGEDAATAAGHAAEVVAFETRLARASRPRPELRDVDRLYHKLDLEGLEKLAPLVPWRAYLEGLGAPGTTDVNVEVPEFVVALEKELRDTDPAVLRAYLRWHAVDAAAPLLSSGFVEADFDFYGTTLSGQQEIEPRWKRCVDATQGALGEAVGRVYVAEHFAGSSKEVAVEMIGDVQQAFATALPGLAWMDETTRERALAKRDAVAQKIGYPDRWRDYSRLELGDGHFANALAAVRFESDRQLAKIGRPVDRDEWRMSPQTVNAYYSPLLNEIVFPAGILQPPFFHRDYPAAMNYGAVGAVMGHELTHGFDDVGRKFDPTGALREWWEPEVSARFDARARCVADAYSAYEVEPGLHVDGTLTLGENIADVGGVKQAFRAYRSWKRRHDGEAPTVGGLSDEQLFFVAFGQVWCAVSTPESDRVRVRTDPHAPPRFRAVGPLVHNPDFAEAFACAPGTPMSPAERCEVW